MELLGSGQAVVLMICYFATKKGLNQSYLTTYEDALLQKIWN